MPKNAQTVVRRVGSKLRDMELWHEVAGGGPAVILIHPGVCDSRVWDPQWDTFPRTQRRAINGRYVSFCVTGLRR